MGQRIRAVRRSLGLTQREFAEAVNDKQRNIAKWEIGMVLPPAAAYLAIARLLPDKDRSVWFELAGVQKGDLLGRNKDESIQTIPLLRDVSLLKSLNTLTEKDIRTQLSFPRSLLPRRGRFYAIRMRGDEMGPIIADGFLLVVDVTQRDAKSLVGEMIAIQDQDDVKLRRLGWDGSMHFVVPQNPGSRYPIKMLNRSTGISILGAVVMWVGR